MKKPVSVKAIVVLAWLSIAAALFFVALAIVATAVAPGEGAFAGFLSGALNSLGFDHSSFDLEDAGYMLGSATFAVIPVAFLLFAVKSRRLWLLRSTSVLWLLLAAANGVAVIPLVVVILSFIRSVRRYCDGAHIEEQRQA